MVTSNARRMVTCYINYWISMFLTQQNGAIFLAFFFFNFCHDSKSARISVSSRCCRILHLHSQWVMHFKSPKRAAIFTRYCWDFLGRRSIRRLMIGVKLCGFIVYSSHEYVYVSFALHRFSKMISYIWKDIVIFL